MKDASRLYRTLLGSYGPQGWWPLLDCKGKSPTKTGSVQGYHPGDYSYPRTKGQRFEICLGAILTQNTAWTNVEGALLNLKRAGALAPKPLLRLEEDSLKNAIRPTGYFNQKARKLRIFTEFFLDHPSAPAREDLLALWGIGPETADSMLLYAYNVPTFVIDAYTRRIACGLGLAKEKATYDELKALFERALEPDLATYQECHALLVEHAKRNNVSRNSARQVPIIGGLRKLRTGPSGRAG